MRQHLTAKFTREVLKLGQDYEAKYSSDFINLEIKNKKTGEVRFMNIHEFIYTHCRDYLIGYSKGFKTKTEAIYSPEDPRIVELQFTVYITIPNLTESGEIRHTETFSGKSELLVYVDAVEWLMNYRNENHQLSKFWVSVI